MLIKGLEFAVWRQGSINLCVAIPSIGALGFELSFCCFRTASVGQSWWSGFRLRRSVVVFTEELSLPFVY